MTKLSITLTLSAALSILTIVNLGCGSRVSPSPRPPKNLLVDDFNSLDGVSQLNTKWQLFTDTVMGGISTAEQTFETIDGQNCIRLTGNVSLENNGGFIMSSLDLKPDGKKMNLSGYQGVLITAKGKEGNYFIQLKTSENWFPWQINIAKFEVTENWQVIKIPFENFKSENTRKSLNVSKAKKIAIMGYKKAFRADIAISKIEFYID